MWDFMSFSISLFAFSSAWVVNNVDSNILDRSAGYEFVGLGENEAAMMAKFSLIYPGTKWCGMGSSAENFDDLGEEVEVDMCCRTHDHCPDIIAAFSTKHNLTNNMFYTRLSCECDTEFYRCLQSSDSSSADTMGKLYFNMIGTQCFRYDYPVTGCKKRAGILNSKCIEYEYDTTKEKAYQWFDVGDYRKSK